MNESKTPSLLVVGIAALTVGPMATARTASSSGDPGRPGADSAGLEVITVTAQKMTEDLQKAASALTVFSGDFLVQSGVTDIRAAQDLVPSVRFQAENASTEIYLRGVGSTLDLPNIEPPNAFNFNGVYIPREGTSVGFFDIAQLEVLPGPQGTLYGRAALGGAVNVTFNRPTRELESSAVLDVGNYSLVHATLVQNVPVTDSLALRAAIDVADRDGYLRTGADSQDDYAGRLSALYEPTEALDIYVWVHGAKQEGMSPNLVRRGFNDGTFAGNPNAYDHENPWNDIITPGAPTASPQNYENLVTGAEVTWDFGGATLTYIPGYFYLDWEAHYWLENIPAFLSAHYNQLTQELRLSGDVGDRWQWLAGLYAYRVTNSGDFIAGGFPLAQVAENQLEGYAGFGEATYEWTDSLRLTLGGRYSHDDRQGDGETAFGAAFSTQQDFDRFDWKVAVEADVAPASMLYATIQTGYQPGTYNLFPATPEVSNLVDSATLTAYTVGIKNRFLDDRLQVNNEAFYYDYQDLLVQSFNLNTGLVTIFSAARTEIYGDQLDILFAPTDADLLNLSVGYLHARYDEFMVPPGVNIGIPQRDFSGYSLQYAPDWTVTAGYQHDFRLDEGYVRARIETRYEDAFWGTFTHARGTQQGDYTKSNASVTYFSGGGDWSLGVWVMNIEDTAVIAATTTGQYGPYGDAFLEPPRTYGVRFTFGL
jgi:iron complex outermembrane receptor protein